MSTHASTSTPPVRPLIARCLALCALGVCLMLTTPARAQVSGGLEDHARSPVRVGSVAGPRWGCSAAVGDDPGGAALGLLLIGLGALTRSRR